MEYTVGTHDSVSDLLKSTVGNIRDHRREHLVSDLKEKADGWKLDPVKKETWCRALEAGDRVQGSGCLLNDEGAFCCLGVYGDTVGTRSDKLFKFNFKDRFDLDVACFTSAGYLPLSVMPSGVQSVLIGANDCGITFAEIAKAIREAL
jgi:hypothetical protein